MLCSRVDSSYFFANAGTVIGFYDKELKFTKLETEFSEDPTLGKKAGCLVFAPNEMSILLGEKSGHVFNIAIHGSTSDQTNFEDQDEVLGHLSLLTSVVVSSDGRYIGTCDRDEKIRISRFSQPYVLESFCLGHIKPISDIAFLDNTHLISTATDGYIRLWNAPNGQELDSLNLSSYLRNTDVKDFLASRLIVVENYVLLGIRSHDCILSINISPDFTKFGEVSRVDCPFDEKFVDFCVINHQVEEKVFKVVCMTEPLSRLFFWMVSYDAVSPAKWNQIEDFLELSPELKEQNGKFPRLQMLLDMGKNALDVNGVDVYEKNKEQNHKRIRERHQRHQVKRKRRMLSKEAGDEAAGQEDTNSEKEISEASPAS
nr:tRNA (guanine N(7)) methyltransferase subunit [Hymenolepis microstoma]